jgi:general secretion pathway protein C
MSTSVQSRWAVRATTLVVWLLAGASGAYWALKLMSPSGAPVRAPVAVRAPTPADPAAVARLLGAVPAQQATAPVAALASRFSLLGVVTGPSAQGAALIAVDGKPARPYRIGTSVDEGLVLQSVQGRRAVLAASASGPAVVTLELPQSKRP